jgi:cysteine-S-conjugate beta-lyase
MHYDFDTVIERCNTNSVKWDFCRELFGSTEVLPMWVADMDFQVPQPVIEALRAVAEHGVFGYPRATSSYYESVIDWMKNRHNWDVNKEWITCTPGVVPALNWLVKAFTKPGDKVLLQAPVYPPFFKAIENNGCQVVNNPLKLEDGQLLMDFVDLEEKLSQGVKVMLLCSPHNPGGRVWSREELEQVGKLCLKYGVIVVADEIHHDLVFKGFRNTCFATLSKELAENCVVCTAPSKTFNLAGLQVANIIIPNPKLRSALRQVIEVNGHYEPSIFGLKGVEAAYRHGEDWLEQLMAYLEGNLDYLIDYFEANIPQVKVIRPQGTYLVWLDFRDLGMETKALQRFLHQQAKIGLNSGHTFGQGGEGFQRMNIACPRKILAEGLTRLAQAVLKHGAETQI